MRSNYQVSYKELGGVLGLWRLPLGVLQILTGLFPTVDQQVDHSEANFGTSALFGQITGPCGGICSNFGKPRFPGPLAYCSRHQVA